MINLHRNIKEQYGLEAIQQLWQISPWAISRVQNKVINSNREDTRTSNNNNSNTNEEDNGSTNNNNNSTNTSTSARTTNKSIGYIVIPYTKGTAESIKHICGKYGIQVHFKGNTTIKQILMKPKDPDPKDNRSGLIYSYRCPQLDCNEEYIGETGRTLGEGRKEHLKQPSPIHGHSQTTGHPIEDQNFNIVGKEDRGQARTIKDSIYIRVNNPTLNQNIGKYNLIIYGTEFFLIPQGSNWVLPKHPAAKH